MQGVPSSMSILTMSEWPIREDRVNPADWLELKLLSDNDLRTYRIIFYRRIDIITRSANISCSF